MYRTFFRKVLWLGALLLLLLPVGVMAEPLDEIEEEIIYLKTREDGSLDIQYHIEWKVLDSTSEGPLNWVKIGIPNAYVEDMKALSDSIENIRYYGSDGDYVRLDLDRDYEAGEVVELDFSIHQHRMYREEDGAYVYEFTPGWFDEMEVRKLAIFWEQDPHVESDMTLIEEEGKYGSVFEDLWEGEKVTVTMKYPMEQYQFQDTYDQKADHVQRAILQGVLTVGGIIGPFIFALVLIFMRNKREWKTDYYEKNRGFGAAM